MTPTLHLSCAVSADGYLDDTRPARAVLSSAEDLEAVLALRARMDMIVVGAETLRRDNPSLATRGDHHFAERRAAGLADHPIKIVITRSGIIPSERAFFHTADAKTIVLSQSPTDAPGTVERFKGDPIDALLRLATVRNAANILIEGGAQILRLALPRARSLRLAVSPRRMGQHGHAPLFDDVNAFLKTQQISQTDTLGDTAVYHLDLLATRARPVMARAFELSRQCPPSKTAFAVGAIGCTDDLSILATGYSRETGPKDHAEEALLSKLTTPPHTVVCTLEPCLTRASKPKGCAQRLVDAGVSRVIYAVAEDATFTEQTGLRYLREHGVELVQVTGFEREFRAVNGAVYG